MKMMMAFRRVSTPITPMVNRTALKKRDSASIGALLPLAEHHRAHDGGEQEDARHLEGQQVLVEEGAGEGGDGAGPVELAPQRALRQRQRLGDAGPREG